MGPLLQAAQAGGYGLAGFNVDNLAMLAAVVRAAEEESAPLIVQGGPVGLDHAGWEETAALVRLAARRSHGPIALHLDHGATLAHVTKALELGFTSVMFDGSALPYREKVSLTRRVVRAAHEVGATVEAELGAIPGSEEGVTVSDEAASLTDPRAAAAFVDETGVDCLAIAIGNVHWTSNRPTVLDLERLRAIREAVAIPLVLHGGSGVADAVLRAAVAGGITKLNIANAINRAFIDALRGALDSAEVDLGDGRIRVRPHNVLSPAVAAACQAARERLRVLGASNRAPQGDKS